MKAWQQFFGTTGTVGTGLGGNVTSPKRPGSASSLFLFLWRFLFVQVEDGLFVDGVETSDWCISGLDCVGDEEQTGIVHRLRRCHQPREFFIRLPTYMFFMPTSGGQFCPEGRASPVLPT